MVKVRANTFRGPKRQCYDDKKIHLTLGQFQTSNFILSFFYKTSFLSCINLLYCIFICFYYPIVLAFVYANVL